MKLLSTALLIMGLAIAPLISYAQMESVVQPDYGRVYEEENTSPGSNAILNQLVTEEAEVDASIGSQEETNSTSQDALINSEASNKADESGNLDDFVDSLNKGYQEAQEQCTTRSWLGNIWCTIKSWW